MSGHVWIYTHTLYTHTHTAAHSAFLGMCEFVVNEIERRMKYVCHLLYFILVCPAAIRFPWTLSKYSKQLALARGKQWGIALACIRKTALWWDTHTHARPKYHARKKLHLWQIVGRLKSFARWVKNWLNILILHTPLSYRYFKLIIKLLRFQHTFCNILHYAFTHPLDLVTHLIYDLAG